MKMKNNKNLSLRSVRIKKTSNGEEPSAYGMNITIVSDSVNTEENPED